MRQLGARVLQEAPQQPLTKAPRPYSSGMLMLLVIAVVSNGCAPLYANRLSGPAYPRGSSSKAGENNGAAQTLNHAQANLGITKTDSASPDQIEEPNATASSTDADRPQMLPIYLQSFVVNFANAPNVRRGADREDFHYLKQVYRAYIEDKNPAAVVLMPEDFAGEKVPSLAALARMHVKLTLYERSARTIIAEFFAPTPYNPAGFITPHWGDIEIKMETTLVMPNGTESFRHTQRSNQSFAAFFFTMLRTAYVEEVYRQTYNQLFKDSVEALHQKWPEIYLALHPKPIAAKVPARHTAAFYDAYARAIAGDQIETRRPLQQGPHRIGKQDVFSSYGHWKHALCRPPPPLQTPPHFEPTQQTKWDGKSKAPLSIPDSGASDDQLWIRYQQARAVPRNPNPPSNFGVIRQPMVEPPQDTLAAILDIFGGIEATGFAGYAHVKSSVKDENGQDIEVAAGDAVQKGYRISLYSAPEVTGFSIYPTGGFQYQKLDIEDFRATLPRTTTDPLATDIGATCSDLDGNPVPCDAPNTYDLELRSFFGGVRAGFDLVIGSPSFRMFWSLSGGVNLAEYRTLKSRIAQYSNTNHDFTFFNSVAGGLAMGLAFPKLHFAARFLVDAEYYFNYKYGNALEFQGPATYNPETNRYYRPRVFVDSAKFDVANIQFALAYTF